MRKMITSILMKKMLLLGFIIPFFSAFVADGWEEVNKSDDGSIIVYNRTVEGFELREMKAIGIVQNTTVEAFAKIILDPNNYASWLKGSDESRLITTTDTSIIYYSVSEAPWPVDDRDLYAEMKSEQKPGYFKAEVLGIPKYAPKEDGKVRIELLKMSWIAIKQGKNIKVTYQCLTNPGGSLPTWMVSSTTKSTPLETIESVQNKLGQ